MSRIEHDAALQWNANQSAFEMREIAYGISRHKPISVQNAIAPRIAQFDLRHGGIARDDDVVSVFHAQRIAVELRHRHPTLPTTHRRQQQ